MNANVVWLDEDVGVGRAPGEGDGMLGVSRKRWWWKLYLQRTAGDKVSTFGPFYGTCAELIVFWKQSAQKLGIKIDVYNKVVGPLWTSLYEASPRKEGPYSFGVFCLYEGLRVYKSGQAQQQAPLTTPPAFSTSFFRPQQVAGHVEWLGAVKDPQACEAWKQQLVARKSVKASLSQNLVAINSAIQNATQAGMDTTDLQATRMGLLADLAKTEADIVNIEANIKDACQEVFVPPTCPQVPCGPNEDCVDGKCVPKCDIGYVRDPVTGACVKAGGGGGGSGGGGGGSVIGILLLAAAALGGIFLAARGVGSRSDNPHCPSCY